MVIKINFHGGKNQIFPCDTRKFPCQLHVHWERSHLIGWHSRHWERSHLIGWHSRQNVFWWAAVATWKIARAYLIG